MRRWSSRADRRDPPRVPFEELERVLLVKLRSLGDCVLTTPCLRVLKARHPRLRVDVAVEDRFRAVFESNPLVHRTWAIPWDGRRYFRHRRLRKELGFRLREAHYDAVLDFSGSMTSRVIMRLTGAPLRAGFGQYHLPHLYTHRVGNPARYFPGEKLHNVQFLAGLLRGLGVELPAPLPPTELHVPDPARRSAADRLSAAGLGGGPFVLVQPTATLASKQWPPERFGEVVRGLRRERSCGVVLSCAPHESGIAGEVARAAGEDLPVFDDLSLPELAAVMERASAFLGCDSGPAHMAAALGRPVCVIFGSSNRDLWRPWGEGHAVVGLELPCSPCPGKQCPQTRAMACILDIPTEQVLRAVSDLLQRAVDDLKP